jgi:hypothetical protein
MWKANGKTIALLLFLASPVPKTRGYWKLKEKALDRPLWRTGFVIGYGLSKTDCGMNDDQFY